MDFDETRLYYSHQALRRNEDQNNDVEDDPDGAVATSAVRRHFREFLSAYFEQECLYYTTL